MLTQMSGWQSNRDRVEVSLTGQTLLETPLLNKGSVFPEDERRALHLLGLLPYHVAPVAEQLARTYENYLREDSDLGRYIYLASLQDRNEVLFYRLVLDHIREMSPVVYTPVVGVACQHYSHIYRRPRGLYVSYPYRDEMDALFQNSAADQVRVIVVTDGERILGLGDLGVGGMGIPVGKLALYTLCAGIHPAATLPIILDVGTDNRALLADPLYLGWHHERVRGADYDAFIEAFVQAVQRYFPHALLQWEDFAKGNAHRLLERYRDRLCTFNDDIQGTGAVTLAGLLSAVNLTGSKLSEQRVVMLGAGSAAIGIADQLVAAMASEGLPAEEARRLIWLVDTRGLVHSGRDNIEAEKAPYAQAQERVAGWPVSSSECIGLDEVVAQVHPTILIGTAACPGVFAEATVREMAAYIERPVIFPLSNPTSQCEACPADLLAWTEGRALIATGSPFQDVMYNGRAYCIGQCNNMFIFPGMGLGALASGARRVTNEMLLAAARALSACSPARKDPTASLYPAVEDVRAVSRDVAIAVASAAQQAGVAEQTAPEELERRVRELMWEPQYPRLLPRREEPPVQSATVG
jgi:malate dehydrogenase (oxaloacetate-decarboxylating)